MRSRAALAIALALCVDRALAQDSTATAAAAPASVAADTSRASAAVAGADTSHAAALGDLRPATPDSSRVLSVQALGALADSLTATMARLAAAHPRLAPDDRQVFEELVAAAREMADGGDLEGAALVIEDARQLVSKKAR